MNILMRSDTLLNFQIFVSFRSFIQADCYKRNSLKRANLLKVDKSQKVSPFSIICLRSEPVQGSINDLISIDL